ncbi:hypothetical protein JCM1841_005865 [Sporobolomyces salmonicolor]
MLPHHIANLSTASSTASSTPDYASSASSSPRSSQLGPDSLAQAVILNLADDGPSTNPRPSCDDQGRRSSCSDSYDSSAEGNLSIASSVRMGRYASAGVDAPSARRASDALHFGAWSGDEGTEPASYYSSRVSSRANSPAPGADGFDGYLSYRTPSRARSRHASGFSTPTTPAGDKEEYGPDYYHAHHYQTSALLRKLGGTLAPATSPVLGRKQRKPGWWARRAESRRKNTITSPSSASAPLLGSPALSKPRRERSCLSTFGSALLRQPWVPTQPLTILFAILLFLCFAATLTTFLVNVLSSDREPLPWRRYCQEQRPFPHALTDSLKPVNVFVGVFSVDAAADRRNAIRLSYAQHSKPIDPRTGRPAHNVQLKFILGRPRAKWSKRIALEMEMFNDLVVLDVEENMNKGKTFQYFAWANENATVPVYYARRGEGQDGGARTVGVGFQKADYVVKADDDSFIVLSELERHLRITPRENTYWGYLVRNRFMAGEVYALSSDLVSYLATYPRPKSWTIGKEDQRVAKWMRNHPNASSIHWITERCQIYDHPKAGTTYSRGFTFPDHVEQVRLEGRRGISEDERVRRGGELWQSYSTVTTWKKPYAVPAHELSVEEQVEALIEGGGRWSNQGWRSDNGRGPQAVKYDAVVFSQTDRRLVDPTVIEAGLRDRPDTTATGATPGVPDRAAVIPSARTTRFGKDLFRDPDGIEAVAVEKGKKGKRSAHMQEGPTRAPMGEGEYEIYNLVRGPFEDELVKPSSEVGTTSLESATFNSSSSSASSSILSSSGSSLSSSSSTNNTNLSSPSSTSSSSGKESLARPAPPVYVNEPTGQIRLGGHAYTVPYTEERFIPAPTLRYDPASLSVRSQRMLGLKHGGTVAVHYLKRNEWFYETALALLGREKMWDGGIDTPAYPLSPVSAYAVEDLDLSTTPPFSGAQAHDDQLKVEAFPALWGGVRMYGSPIVRADGMIVEGRRAEANREVIASGAGNGWAGKLGRATGGGRTMGMMALAVPEGMEVEIGGGEVEEQRKGEPTASADSLATSAP